MDPKAKVAVLELARGYAEQAGAYLAQGLERKPSVEEIQQFCGSASSILLGSLYASVRKHQGPEEAERALRNAIGFTTTIVRLMGVPVAMQFEVTIKETPGPTVADSLREKKPEPKKEETCACALDAEGKCQECISRIGGFYVKLSGVWSGMGKLMRERKDSCTVCERTQYDQAISRIVPDILKIGDDILKMAGDSVKGDKAKVVVQIGQEMMAMLYSSSNGVPMPLTDAAWQAAVQKRVEKDTVTG